MQLDLPEILLLVVVLGALGYYIWYVASVIRKKPVTGVESLIGAKGLVHSERGLSPDGEVSVNGVIWRARLADTQVQLKKGDPVVVRKVDELTLVVIPGNSVE
jgi:membrane protein implicated in regulation of membrane protease activity